VIRDITPARQLENLARGAAEAEQERVLLLNAVISGLSRAGLSLQTAAGLLPSDARQRIEAVQGDLDDIIGQIRGSVFTARNHRAGIEGT